MNANWEYRCETADDMTDIEMYANDMGSRGWEMVSFSHRRDAKDWLMIFKRPTTARVEQTVTILARCPVNGQRDSYKATFTFDRTVNVESILDFADTLIEEKVFQEHLTQKLAEQFRPCFVRTVGFHSGVEVVVYADSLNGKK